MARGAARQRAGLDHPCLALAGARGRAGGPDASATAETAELAKEVLQLATKDAAPPPKPDAGIVSMGFWHRSARLGVVRSARQVTAEPWAAIQANYPAAARQ